MRETFDRFVELIQEYGPIEVIPQKTRISIMAKVRFAGCVVRKRWLLANLWLTRKELSGLYPETEMVIANVWPLGRSEYAGEIQRLFSPSWLLMAHHGGRGDSMVRRNGGAEAMEEAMSRPGMRGRIFGERMQCEAL